MLKMTNITFFFYQQELKKAIIDDLVRLGKASGLHSFEQVGRQLYVCLLDSNLFVIAVIYYCLNDKHLDCHKRIKTWKDILFM